MKKIISFAFATLMLITGPTASAQIIGSGWNGDFGLLQCEITANESSCSNELFGTINLTVSKENSNVTGAGILATTFNGENNFTVNTTYKNDNTLFGTITSPFFGSFQFEGATYIPKLNVANDGNEAKKLNISDLAKAVFNKSLTDSELDKLKNHILNSIANY
jgi:hypothetical protein